MPTAVKSLMFSQILADGLNAREVFLSEHSKWLNQELTLPSEGPVLEIPAQLGCLKMLFQKSSEKSEVKY